MSFWVPWHNWWLVKFWKLIEMLNVLFQAYWIPVLLFKWLSGRPFTELMLVRLMHSFLSLALFAPVVRLQRMWLWLTVPHSLNYSLQSLWIERTTLTLTHSLPGISRWFEVERRELVTFILSVIRGWNDELLRTWDRQLKTHWAEILLFKMVFTKD